MTAALPSHPRRIAVIGCPGAGKSTLSRALAERLRLPLHHLDQLWWQPGWVETTMDDFDEKLHAILDTDAWIIDGNYSRTLEARVSRADLVIHLDYPRWLCLSRAVRRILASHGRSRPDMAPGCPERLDREFLTYIWHFRRDVRPRLAAVLDDYPGRCATCRSPREAERLLARLAPSPEPPSTPSSQPNPSLQP